MSKYIYNPKSERTIVINKYDGKVKKVIGREDDVFLSSIALATQYPLQKIKSSDIQNSIKKVCETCLEKEVGEKK